MRHGPGQRPPLHRRELDPAHCPEGRHQPPDAPGAQHSDDALQPGKDSDGGFGADRHIPGPGEPPGKGCHPRHQDVLYYVQIINQPAILSDL